MSVNWYLVYACALGCSFVLAALFTEGIRRFALRYDFVDRPGERKVHVTPMPLLGGVAIFASFAIVVTFSIAGAVYAADLGFQWLQAHVLAFFGDGRLTKLSGLFLGGALIFALGVVDDLKTLSPERKLVGQIGAAIIPVWCGIRVDLFIDNIWLSAAVTIFWVVMMTNSLNFLDNMDGLCGGISIIGAASFFLVALPNGQTFICTLLLVFIGAVAGFLLHNISPARIFMGDAGAMFCGYMLAIVAVLITFYTPESPSRMVLAAPLLALSVPIFDTVSTVLIRIRRGESIMKGDKRHFSHRLVYLGMTQLQAVEFIYLVAAVNGLGAVLLNQVSLTGTIIILGQAAGMFCLIVLLMNVGHRNGRRIP